MQLRPQIHPVIAASRYDMLLSRGSPIEGIGKMRQQLREDRHSAAVLAFMVFRLAASDCEPGAFPVDVTPAQRQHFGRAPQAAPATQGKDQSPFPIGARIKHFRGHRGGHEELAFRVAANRGFQLGEGVAGNQPLADCVAQELLRPAARPADRVRGKSLGQLRAVELFCIGLGDVAERLVRAEERQEPLAGLVKVHESLRFNIHLPARDVTVDESCEGLAITISGPDEPYGSDPAVHLGVEAGHPTGNLVIGNAGDGLPDERFHLHLERGGLFHGCLAEPNRLPLAVCGDEQDALVAVRIVADGCHCSLTLSSVIPGRGLQRSWRTSRPECPAPS
jgi:hypothetical protein